MRRIPVFLASLGLLGLLAGGCQPTTSDQPPAFLGKDSPAGRKAIAGLMERAFQAYDRRSYEEALGLVDSVLAGDPGHRDGLLFRGVILGSQADSLAPIEREKSVPLYLDAAKSMRELRRRYPELRPQERGLFVQALYDEARTLAYQGKPEATIETLREAIDAGLDASLILDEDPELAQFADREDYQNLKVRFRERRVEQLREELAAFPSFSIDFALPTLAGETATLADLRGEKVTILDIWGTWCPPCRMEIPHFAELYERYRDKGLQIIGVTYENTDNIDEARPKVQSFLEETPIPYPIVLTGGDFLAKVPDFQGFPTTLFLDAEGKVRMKLVGYQSSETLEAVVNALLTETPANRPGSPSESTTTTRKDQGDAAALSLELRSAGS